MKKTPDTFISFEAILPPVQDSTVVRVRLFSFNKSTTTASKDVFSYIVKILSPNLL